MSNLWPPVWWKFCTTLTQSQIFTKRKEADIFKRSARALFVRKCCRACSDNSESTIIREEKQHKHKLFGPDFTRTFPTLTPGCPGVKKFLPTTGAAGKRTSWCGRPRFSARTSMTRRVVEKLCTKKVCVDFLAPIQTILLTRRGIFRSPFQALSWSAFKEVLRWSSKGASRSAALICLELQWHLRSGRASQQGTGGGNPESFCKPRGEFSFGAPIFQGQVSAQGIPQESFEVIFNLRKLFLFPEVIFKTTPKIHCKQKAKNGNS